MNRPRSPAVRRALLIARTLVALVLGFITLQVVLYGTILLVMPDLMRGASFPRGSALIALLMIEILAGAAGVFVAAMLGGRAMARHGWALGLIIMAFNVWVVTEPDSPWTMAPAIVVVAAVPLQAWAAVAFAKRLRRKGRPHAEIAEGVGVA